MERENSLIGKHIGSYQVVAEIARKMFVQVYQGQHSIFTDCLVILKLFNAHSLSQHDYQRFAEEVRKLAQIKHPEGVS